MKHLTEEEYDRATNVLKSITAVVAGHTSSDMTISTRINPGTAFSLLTSVRSVAETLLSPRGDGTDQDAADLIDEIDAALATANRFSVQSVPAGAGDPAADGSVADRVDNLKRWWVSGAASEIGMVAEKAVTYGSNSLEQLGRKMAKLNGREVNSEEAQELGIWVYIVGKIERWTDAVMRGERPKDDTILDIGIYARMAQRNRSAGGWPDRQGT